jgi:hypothetical protein
MTTRFRHSAVNIPPVLGEIIKRVTKWVSNSPGPQYVTVTCLYLQYCETDQVQEFRSRKLVVNP